MLALCFDTETTGFTNKAMPPQHSSQPHLVELGAVLIDTATGCELETLNLIVKPDGYEIPTSASDVHGITTELATKVGIPLLAALAPFSHLCKAADYHVAHNTEFDMVVLIAAFWRAGRPWPAVNARCTKNMAEPVIKLPPTERMIAAGMGHKFKAPSLSECYQFFFGEELTGAHGALVDALACARVYLELCRRAAETTVGELV